MSKGKFLTLFWVALFLFPFATAQAGGKVEGKFMGNGKDGNLTHAMAMKGEPFSGKETTVIILTEKDASGSTDTDSEARNGKFGNALTLKVNTDNKLVGTYVYHQAHEKKGFSSGGQVELTEFKIEGKNASGTVKTKKEYDFFDDKWSIDLTFMAPMK